MRVIILAFAIISLNASAAFKGLSILQGSTTETETIIRAIKPIVVDGEFNITNSNGDTAGVLDITNYTYGDSPFEINHLKISKLNPNETYTLSFTPKNEQLYRWKDTREFKTLKSKDRFKFLVTSCMSDAYAKGDGVTMWNKALRTNPDMMFLIGDNAYADTYSSVYIGHIFATRPAQLWRRHMDHAFVIKLYFAKKLIPTYVTWDDHEYGENDGGSSYKYKNESAQIFNQFFPRFESKNLNKGPGVSSAFSFGSHTFHFLDARSFRDDSKNGEHFGKAQTKWFFDNLNNSKGQNWIIKGDQFFGGYHKFESFEGDHPSVFNTFMNKLNISKKPYHLISGDRHLIEIIKPYSDKTNYEFTVSGMHTKTYAGSHTKNPNPNRIGGFDGALNFAVFEINKDEYKFKAYTLTESPRINFVFK